MTRYCSECGNPVGEDTVYCDSCGTKVVTEFDMQVNTAMESIAKKPEKKIVKVILSARHSAPAFPGETAFSGSGESIISLFGPFKFIATGFVGMLRGIKNVFKNKKALIVTGILIVIWITLIILQMAGFNPISIKILSFLTYAQGGVSGSFFRALGGLVGKGIFVTFFLSFFTGGKPFKGFFGNIKSVFTSLRFSKMKYAAVSVLSIGFSLIIYNFISGYARLWNSTAGIAALIMTIRAFGNNNGFLKNFIATLIARKSNNSRSADSSLVRNVLAGLAVGFAVALPISLIKFYYLPYCIGAFLVVLGIVFAIVQKGSAKERYAVALLALMAFVNLMPLMAIAKGSDDEWAGTWTLKDIKIFDKSAGFSGYYSEHPEDLTRESLKATKTVYDHEFRYTGDELISDIGPIHIYKGEFVKTKITVKEPPKYIRENEKVTINVTFDVYDSYIKYYDNIYYTVSARMNVYKGKEISNSTRVNSPFNLAKLELKEKLSKKVVDTSAYAPYGLVNGEIMGLEIEMAIDGYNQDILIALGHTSGEHEFSTVKVVYLYEWKYGVNNMVVNSEAAEGPGETDVPVPAAIITSVLGVLISGGAAGAASNLGEMAREDKKGSRYKMSIRKDFGNKIRFNDPPVLIYARMVEITKEGNEIDRPDLTSMIEVFSQDASLIVSKGTMVDNYMGAYISAEDKGKTEGTVSFRFCGEGGNFQNNVIFNLIGKPYIQFMDIKAYSGIKMVEMIMGDTFTYEAEFEVKDFMDMPEVKLSDKNNTDFAITIEKIDDVRFKAVIENNSKKADKPNTLSVTEYISVVAENEKEYTESQFCIAMYPEGISVKGNFENDRLKITAYPNESAGDLDPVIKATRVDVVLAVIDNDEQGKPACKLVDLKDANITIGNLKGTNKITEVLASKFKYKINSDSAGDGIYYIEPETTLPEDKEPFYLTLPVNGGYNGKSYQLELPVRLLGEKLEPMKGWNEEYELLKARIRKFGISNEVALVIRQHSKDMSVSQLRLLSKKIVTDAIDYYTSEGKEYTEIADSLERWENFLGVLKWFGDQAFSYLMTVYTGPVGDALISPAKEIVVALIGEAGTQLISGESFNFDNLQVGNNIAAAFENYLLTMIGGENVDIRKAGVVLAGFAVFNMAKHYVMDVDAKGNRDFYTAITSAFGDLTATAMKAVAGEYFGRFVKNPKVAAKIEAWGGRWLRANLPDMALQKPGQDILKDGLTRDTAYIFTKVELVQKYVEELCGLGAAKAYTYINEGTEKLISNDYVMDITLYSDKNNPQNDIKVSVDLVKVKNKLLDYVFNTVFNSFPFPSTVLYAPEDPPYYTDIN